MDFVERLEEFCSSEQSVQNLRDHPSSAAFNNKWNLPVYFQIRLVFKKVDSFLTGIGWYIMGGVYRNLCDCEVEVGM